jgi:hypothetical protein
MFFGDYKKHPDAKINSSLLWEYNIDQVDYAKMQNLIVERVIERGWPEDWYALLNLYGVDGVISVIKELPYLNDKDMNFVAYVFNLPLTALKCYTNKQSARQHWNS